MKNMVVVPGAIDDVPWAKLWISATLAACHCALLAVLCHG